MTFISKGSFVVLNKNNSLVFLIIMLLLSACTTQRAMSLYEKGQYLESVSVVTNELDRKGKLPMDILAKKMFAIIHGSIQHYEQRLYKASSEDHDEKIAAYRGLLNIRIDLEDKFYSSEFTLFIAKNKIDDLTMSLAEQFYLKGNLISPSNTIDHKIKADIYRLGLEFTEYKDMRALMEKHDKKYADLASEEAYKNAMKAVQNKQYRSASEYFGQVVQLYKNYGDYKNSQALFTQYDKLWRTDAAQDAYTQAQNLSDKTNNSKATHRKIADLYNQANNYYSPYGSFKDSYSLALKHKKLGVVNIALDIKKSYPRNSNLESAIEKNIKSQFSKDYQSFSGYTASSDLIITITYDVRYDLEQDKIEEKNLNQEIDGVVKYFKETVTHRKNHYSVNVYMNVSGLTSFSDKFNISESSSEMIKEYSGDVPYTYHNKRQGLFKSERDFETAIINRLNYELPRMLSHINYEIERY